MALPPIIPWEAVQIPVPIQNELNRRKVNRSFNYVDGAKGEWDSETGEWTKYRGPMSPWVRVCSNGAGKADPKGSDTYPKQGFVLFGGKGFYNEYGFNKGNTADSKFRSIIGFLPDGKTPHIITNDLQTSDYPIHVPTPEIDRISVTIQKELFRRASIEWTCFSKAQLEYMTPYFLVPGISCILEWGWNLYNPECLLDLTDTSQLKLYNCNPYPLYTDHILKSNGNYDVLFGRITHFEWTVEGNKFKCKTEVTSQDRIYSGLVIDSKAEVRLQNEGGDETSTSPFGSLTKFVNDIMPKFRNIAKTDNPKDVVDLKEIVTYIEDHHKENWEEYVYGIFYGRDPEEVKSSDQYDNKKEDFDRKAQNESLWLNLGLVIECINYFASPLKGLCGKSEIFRIDIDDVVINGHPNLISCDGGIMLVPNAFAPKCHAGKFAIHGQVEKNVDALEIINRQRDNELASAKTLGERHYIEEKYQQKWDKFSKKDENQRTNSLLRTDYGVMQNSSNSPAPKAFLTKEEAEQKKALYDYRLAQICGQEYVLRDDLDEIINRVRYYNTFQRPGDNAFPFIGPRDGPTGSKPYPAKYAGYLKDLYVNIVHIKNLVNDSSIKTYFQLIEKLMQTISDAAGGFWDFRLVSGTGKKEQAPGEPATMKIVDYKFMNTINQGTAYTFDYFDVDSLLLGIGFKPTLSNAQAIRTIYAQTNQPDKNVVLTNGNNELLDYMFKDRLAMDNDNKTATPPPKKDDQHAETMRSLQQISPTDGAYQITTRNSGKILVRRLALPAPDVLKMLLDDGDEENNPKYTGIMPGIQATFTIQGIGGLRTFMVFLVRNLPEPYSHENICFRIVDVQDSIESGKWTTTITAGVIPLRDYIRQRLGLPPQQK